MWCEGVPDVSLILIPSLADQAKQFPSPALHVRKVEGEYVYACINGKPLLCPVE